MKVLTLNVAFLLPDDFKGGLNEALEEVISYRRKMGYGVMPDEVEGPHNIPKLDDVIWNGFLKIMEEGKKLFGGLFIGTWKDGKWVNIRKEVEDA